MKDKLFSDYYSIWLELKSYKLQPSTYRNYKCNEKIITEYFRRTNITCSNITSDDINMFYSYLHSIGKSNNRIIKYHQNIRTCVSSLVNKKIVPTEVLFGIDKPKKTPYLPCFYSNDEFKQLSSILLSNDNNYMYVPVLLSLYLGLRRSDECVIITQTRKKPVVKGFSRDLTRSYLFKAA